jgi:ADP-ribosyl-[dinitrogen reductase] hydrolase
MKDGLLRISVEDRYTGSMLGLAVGDAVGTATEFKERGGFDPVTDMIGGGMHNLKAGQWTDDTSMALCLAKSLIRKEGFDAKDQMDLYAKWKDEGYLSSTGKCFDIGVSTKEAIERYQSTGNPLAGLKSPDLAGNGSIMRLAPVILYYYPDKEKAIHYAKESSLTTHATPEAVSCCEILAIVIIKALEGKNKNEILASLEITSPTENISKIAKMNFFDKNEDEISSSAYSVHTLESALWCFYHSDSFKDCILKATNLGNDADTVSAVAGQIAGAYYGFENIPPHWRERLVQSDLISDLAEALR